MLHHSIDNTVIRIRALMPTLQPRPPFIACDPQRDTVLGAEFLKLRHDTVGNSRGARGVEAVHHGGEEGKLTANCMGEEVRVDEDGVRGSEGGIVGEEKGAGDLGASFGGRSNVSDNSCTIEGGKYISRTNSSPLAFRLAPASPLSRFFFLRSLERSVAWWCCFLDIVTMHLQSSVALADEPFRLLNLATKREKERKWFTLANFRTFFWTPILG